MQISTNSSLTPPDAVTNLTIPQQGAKDLPLSDVAFDNDPNKREVSFALAGVPGDPKFHGKLSADAQKIEGTFSQGGADLPCYLERKGDPASMQTLCKVGIEHYDPSVQWYSTKGL